VPGFHTGAVTAGDACEREEDHAGR
jgi:hypothetical protein